MEISLRYNKDDYVEIIEFNSFTMSVQHIKGYIVGFKYTTSCYLKTPSVMYAVLEESDYYDNKESIYKNEKPFEFRLHWVKEEDIRKLALGK